MSILEVECGPVGDLSGPWNTATQQDALDAQSGCVCPPGHALLGSTVRNGKLVLQCSTGTGQAPACPRGQYRDSFGVCRDSAPVLPAPVDAYGDPVPVPVDQECPPGWRYALGPFGVEQCVPDSQDTVEDVFGDEVGGDGPPVYVSPDGSTDSGEEVTATDDGGGELRTLGDEFTYVAPGSGGLGSLGRLALWGGLGLLAYTQLRKRKKRRRRRR